MTYRTPDYRLTEDFVLAKGGTFQDPEVIRCGDFVRPIEYCYLPNHIKDSPEHRFFDAINMIFCYTSRGFVPVPRKIIKAS